MAEQPTCAVASQRAEQARASGDAPPLVVGPATADRIVESRGVPGASDSALLRRRLDRRTTSGAEASDSSTRLVQVLQKTATGLQAGAPVSAELDQLGMDGAAVAVSAVSKANCRSYQSGLSVFHQTMTQIFGIGVLPDIAGGIEALQTTPMHGGLIHCHVAGNGCLRFDSSRRRCRKRGSKQGGVSFSRIGKPGRPTRGARWRFYSLERRSRARPDPGYPPPRDSSMAGRSSGAGGHLPIRNGVGGLPIKSIHSDLPGMGMLLGPRGSWVVGAGPAGVRVRAEMRITSHGQKVGRFFLNSIKFQHQQIGCTALISSRFRAHLGISQGLRLGSICARNRDK